MYVVYWRWSGNDVPPAIPRTAKKRTHSEDRKCCWLYIRTKSLSSQPNKQCRNGRHTSGRDHDKKTQAVIVYKFMMGQEILLVSNDHTTPYPESQKKIWDILLSLVLAPQTLTSHTIKQAANFLYRINPTKGKTSTTISHSASPFWKTFSETNTPKEKWAQWRQITRGRTTARIVGVPHHS